MGVSHVKNYNAKILRECRRQLGIDIQTAAKKAQIEMEALEALEAGAGGKYPTCSQLTKFAHFYRVPRWVFISDELPAEYQFRKLPAFRKFTQTPNNEFHDYHARAVLAHATQLRSLILELREEQETPIQKFELSRLRSKSSAQTAAEIRKQLNIGDKNFDFWEWREMVEAQGIFVFMTGKYPGWTKTDLSFRGLSAYYDFLPIIIINDSDALRAKSFTLFHEFGHILSKENAIDGNPINDNPMGKNQAENWCNEFAGNVLMPPHEFQEEFRKMKINISDLDLTAVEKLARKFKVSSHCCLRHLLQLKIIPYTLFRKINTDRENKLAQIKFAGIPKRNRPKEISRQYGGLFAKTLIQAYHDKEIGLHKLGQLLELKQTSYVLKILEDVK